ncbi:MAG: hypothetical protein ACO1OB_27335 [Archangium sp.]
MDLLLPVLLVVMAVWAVRGVFRKFRESREQRAFFSRPGASADNAIVLTNAHVIEEARAALRCACGGRVKDLGETPRLGLRVARGRCVECGSDVDLYFVLPELLN